VKGGEPAVSVGEFAAELRRLLAGEAPSGDRHGAAGDPGPAADGCGGGAAAGGEVPAWLRCLQAPHNLAALVAEAAAVALPADDPRAAALFNRRSGT
jgi:hypothetical protein